MAMDKETLEQIEKLNRNLEFASSTIANLSIQLTSLGQEPDKLCTPLLAPRDNTNTTGTHGYVNWNSSHDILKTKIWKKLSMFTKYCGTIERWENPHFDFDDIGFGNVVDEETRFPKDDLFVNVCNPLVRAEILYIKEVKRPVEGLVERFLETARNDMHTLSSFEEKYALKWAEPLLESSDGIKTTLTPELNLTLAAKSDNDTQVEPASITRSIDNSLIKQGLNLEPIKDAFVQHYNGSLIKAATILEPGSASLVKPDPDVKPINSFLAELAAISEPINDSLVEPEIILEPENDSVIEPASILNPINNSLDEPTAISESINGSLIEKTIILEPGTDSMVEPPATSEPINGSSIKTATTLEPGNDSMVEMSPNIELIESVHNISESLPKDAELKEVESANKPTKNENLSEEELHKTTMELIEKLKKILDSLTTQKPNILLNEIKALKINNQKQLEVLVDLLYEKATEDSDFSKTCAAISLELTKLRVPSDNNPDKSIIFRNLLIGKCQCFFDELLEETISTSFSDDQEELQIILNEEVKKNKMRANIKYIGELYKMRMLTCRIMEYCIRKLIEKPNDEKLECLCELLNTIGRYVENESWIQLNVIFSKMEEIVDCKSNNISSRVRFMIQDIINLRKRNWVIKSVFDSQLKTMEQIQEEAEQRALLINFVNKGRTGFGGDFDIKRKNSSIDTFAPSSTNNYSVDTLKLNAITHETLDYVKLPPKYFESINESMPDVLEKFQADQPSCRELFTDLSLTKPVAQPNLYSYQSNSASIRTPYIKNSAPVVPQEPFPNDKMKLVVKSIIDLSLINSDDRELEADVNLRFLPKYHAALIAEIINVAIEKPEKEINTIANSLFHLVASKTIAPDNLIDGFQETFEFAPDLFIDIPKLYDILGKVLAPHLAKKYITLAKMFELCENIILVNQGHLFLHGIIRNLNVIAGPIFVKNAWVESGLQLNKWMKDEQVPEWIADNKLYFGYKQCDASIFSNILVA